MCNPTYLPPYAFLFWVPVIVFETFLFSLALRIAYRNYQDIGNWRGAAVLHIILRDNFNFFVYAFVAYIVTATTWLTANPRYFTVPGSFSCALTTIMGCRLILNLCQAFHHPRDPEVTPPQSIWAATSGIRFRGASTASRVGTRWSTKMTREWKNDVQSQAAAPPNLLTTDNAKLSVTIGARTATTVTTTTTTTTTTSGKTFNGQLGEQEIYEMRVVGTKAEGFGERGSS